MYYVDPPTIERTWSIGHVVTAIRFIARQAAKNEDAEADMRSRLSR